MTGGTTLQNSPAQNLVLGFQREPKVDFVRGCVPRPVLHVENFFNRTHKFFRRTMTFQTPLHLQRRCLVHDGLVINPAVTGGTANALLYVNAVIEIGVVRQIVHANPLEWLTSAETRAHRLQIRTFGPNLLVTIHARVRGRHAG